MKLKNLKRSAKNKPQEPSTSRTLSKLSATTTTSCKLYQDLRLTLECFLNCLYENDYSGLVIEGEATEQELSDAWNNIYLLYNRESTGGNDNPIVQKVKEIQEFNGKIAFVDQAVQHLSLAYDEPVIEALNYWGLQCDLIPGEEPFTKLNIIINRARRFVVDRNEAQAELERMQSVETAVTTRDNFDDGLISISKFQGYAVKSTEVSVSQYLKIMKRMESYYNKQMQAANGY